MCALEIVSDYHEVYLKISALQFEARFFLGTLHDNVILEAQIPLWWESNTPVILFTGHGQRRTGKWLWSSGAEREHTFDVCSKQTQGLRLVSQTP